MLHVDLRGADLTGADLRRVKFAAGDLADTKLCHTTLPSGRIDDSGC